MYVCMCVCIHIYIYIHIYKDTPVYGAFDFVTVWIEKAMVRDVRLDKITRKPKILTVIVLLCTMLVMMRACV